MQIESLSMLMEMRMVRLGNKDHANNSSDLKPQRWSTDLKVKLKYLKMKLKRPLPKGLMMSQRKSAGPDAKIVVLKNLGKTKLRIKLNKIQIKESHLVLEERGIPIREQNPR
jgi:uncharacterized protein YjbK